VSAAPQQTIRNQDVATHLANKATFAARPDMVQQLETA